MHHQLHRNISLSLFLSLAAAACGSGAGNGNDGGNANDDGGGPSYPDAGEYIPPMPIDCTHVGSGRSLDVGDGQTYTTLGEVPWSTLGPGDTVRIHHRAAAYHEKILISNSGAEGDPIRICGVAGPGGELPVLDGADATTSPNQRWIGWTELQDHGLIMIAADSDDLYGYRPSYITIEGLVVRGARSDNSYTSLDGSTRTYTMGAAGIYVVPAASITVRGCVITDNANGFFTLSKDEVEGTLVRDVLFERNWVYGNGVVGSDNQHNVYIQALGVLVQYNRLGRLRDGAMGGNLKDRSAGTVVRYNWVEGCARQLDLVDAQDHVAFATADPRYRETFVYGNVILNDEAQGDGGRIVHYGGDTEGFEQNFRKGTLYFYNNTIVTRANMVDRWRTTVVQASTNDEHVDFRDNVVWRVGDTNMAILMDAGVLELGVNWISDGWLVGHEEFAGSVTGEANVIAGADPQLDQTTWAPLAGSPVIDKAGPLAGVAEGAHPVQGEYVPHQQGAERPVNGAASDLGAFEAP